MKVILCFNIWPLRSDLTYGGMLVTEKNIVWLCNVKKWWRNDCSIFLRTENVCSMHYYGYALNYTWGGGGRFYGYALKYILILRVYHWNTPKFYGYALKYIWILRYALKYTWILRVWTEIHLNIVRLGSEIHLYMIWTCNELQL